MRVRDKRSSVEDSNRYRCRNTTKTRNEDKDENGMGNSEWVRILVLEVKI